MTLGQCINLLLQLWPSDNNRRAIMATHAALGTPQHRHWLADVALRGGVFSPAPRVETLWDAGRLEGRREFALEIIELARADPRLLWDAIEKKTRLENRT